MWQNEAAIADMESEGAPTPPEPFGSPRPKPQMITEIVFKNGMMMAVYGSREEILEKLNGSCVEGFDGPFNLPPDWVEFEAHSPINPDNDRGIYSVRTEEVFMVGVERPAPTETVLLDKMGGKIELSPTLGKGMVN